MVLIHYCEMQLCYVRRAQCMAEHHTATHTTMSGQWSALHADFVPSSKLEVDMLIIIE